MITFPDLDTAELAYERVKVDADALPADALAPLNVDLVSAASIALGAVDRIVSYREHMLEMPGFDPKWVDTLADRAKAAWYAYVTNLPATEKSQLAELLQEVGDLRAKLLMWATPLASAGVFDEAAIAKIREGAGNKDAAGDLVALVGLYQSKWDAVQNMCGVTADDLARGAVIAPAVFALIARREARQSSSTEASVRVRRAWTLLDEAYGQCRRAIQYVRWKEEDADLIAPSLRKNSGRSSSSAGSSASSSSAADTPTSTTSASAPTSPSTAGAAPSAAGAAQIPEAAANAPVVGSGEPFGKG